MRSIAVAIVLLFGGCTAPNPGCCSEDANFIENAVRVEDASALDLVAYPDENVIDDLAPAPLDAPFDALLNAKGDAEVDLALAADLTSCMDPVCLPEATVSCGLCGVRACGMDCLWGACTGEGACIPGNEHPCDACSHETCSLDCQWSGCFLLPGSDCRDGETIPCQNPGVCSSSKRCVNCRWPAYCCG